MFEMKLKNEIRKLRLDILLVSVYIFGFIDLFLTYYIQVNVNNSIELNYLYMFGGWSIFLFYKLILPYIMYLISYRYRINYPMYVVLFSVIFVDFWNYLILLNNMVWQ